MRRLMSNIKYKVLGIKYNKPYKPYSSYLIPKITLSILLLAGLASCDIHQFPEANVEPTPTPPAPTDTTENPAAMVNMTLHLNYMPDVYVWEHTYDSKMGSVTETNPGLDLYPEYPGTSEKYSNILGGSLIEVNVKVHKDNNSRTLVAEKSFLTEVEDSYDGDVEIEVPVDGNYLVTVWSHLMRDYDDEPFYDPSDFNSIKLIKERYTGNTDYRDGFRGRLSVSVPDETPVEGEVNMHRPMGKFEFVSTDLSEFLANEEKRQSLATRASAEDYTVVISYPAYYPSAYSAMDDRLENSGTGYSFATNMTITGENEVSLGFDYVMINNNDDAAVQAQVTIFHADGTQVANSGMITIPMRRNRHTVVRGNFLTINGGGGIGIDPDFEGDFNVPIQ